MHFLSALLMLRENGNSPQEVVKDKDYQDNRDNKWGLEKIWDLSTLHLLAIIPNPFAEILRIRESL